jgi:hypothetical protein
MRDYNFEGRRGWGSVFTHKNIAEGDHWWIASGQTNEQRRVDSESQVHEGFKVVIWIMKFVQ